MEPNAKKPRRRETITLPDDLAAKLGCREVYEDELEARLEVCEEMRLEEDGGILRALLSPARDGGFSRDVTQKLNHIFKHRVLRRLSSVDVALLSRVNAACRRGVLAAVGELPTHLPVKEFVFSQERFMWACSNGLPLDDKRTCAAFARGGDWEMLQWARANGCPWDEGTCAAFARGGNLEMLQWARANGCPWDEGTCAAAARGGHLEVLKYARANGCPWNEGTCAAAARGGHLEVLQWARANGCPWDARVVMIGWDDRVVTEKFAGVVITDESHREVLEWVMENGLNPNDERFPGEYFGPFDDDS
jgi:hypothetical protein